MNRAAKRKAMKAITGQGKQKFTLVELQKAFSIALEMKKASRGHLFRKEIKERCIFCGVGRRTKKDCKFWFLTYLDRVQTILINPTFFYADDIEAYFFQHGDEYDGIEIPLLKALDE